MKTAFITIFLKPIIVNLYDEHDGPDPDLNPFKLYDENFPIEELKAMIDE